jgi:hypothetical protein
MSFGASNDFGGPLQGSGMGERLMCIHISLSQSILRGKARMQDSAPPGGVPQKSKRSLRVNVLYQRRTTQSSKAGTKEKTKSHSSRGERGDAEEQPKPNPGILSFLRTLRASVREWLLEISFCHKKKLKISVQRKQ